MNHSFDPGLLDPKQLFSRVDNRERVIVAISGGSDSMALLLLAAAWSHHMGVELQAVTVDHGLRPEAAAEAAFVASTCEGLGVSHVTLAWDGMKPNTGLPEASRLARYQLLEEFALDSGAVAILTGHTSDDQAETVYMRLQREKDDGTGRGLSGMSERTLMPKGIVLHRPLLQVSRDQLRSYLSAHAQSWIEDPSNSDLSYERVRTRLLLQSDSQLRQNLLDFSEKMGRLRTVVSRDASELLGNTVKVRKGLIYAFDCTDADSYPTSVLGLALRVLISIAGGGTHMVSMAKMKPVFDLLEEGDDSDRSRRMTLGNCVLERKSSKLLIYREARNIAPVLLAQGDSAIWDGRFLIRNESSASFYVGPLDREVLEMTEAVRGKRFSVTPRAALKSMPVLKGDDDMVYLPALLPDALPSGVKVKLIAPAISHFCPEFDEPIFRWLKKLAGQVNSSALTGN